MKSGWSRIFSFILGCVIFIGIPLIVSHGYLGWLEAQEIAGSQRNSSERLSLILQKIETLSIPHKRFEAILKHYSEKRLNFAALQKALLRLMKREKGALEVHLFDSKGKLIPEFGGLSVPRAVAERFLKSLIDSNKPISEALVEGYCGNPNGNQILREAPGAFVELFNGEKKSYGGYWTFRDPENRILAYSIAFVNNGLVQKDNFLDRTVKEFNSRWNGAPLVGWFKPFEPKALRPFSQKFPRDLEVAMQKQSLGKVDFRYGKHPGLTHVTREGKVLFGLGEVTRISEQIQTYRVFLVVVGIFSLFVFYRFSGTFFPPVLMFSGKLLVLLMFGAGIPLSILFLTSLTDRIDRENVLIKTIKENQVRHISKIDNAYQAWLNRKFAGYEKLSQDLEGASEKEISNRLKDYFSRTLIADQNMVISVTAVSKNGNLLFSSTREKDVKGKKLPAKILTKIAKNSLDHEREEFVDKSKITLEKKSETAAISEIPLTMEIGSSFLTGFGTDLQSYLTVIGKSKEALILVIQDPKISETRFLQEFTISLNKRDQSHSRLIIVPKVAHPSLRFFPDLPIGFQKKIRSLSDWTLGDEMPRHRSIDLWERCLVSANSGKFLKNYVLVKAYPYALIEAAAKKLNFQLAGFAFVILVLMSGFGWITSRVLLVPVKKLGFGLGALQKRLFRSRVPVDKFGARELIKVEERFNVVMSNLEELNDGRFVQQTLWPEKGLEGNGWSVFGGCVTAAELGGDFLDWFVLPDGRILIAIGDVAGHGVAASLITASAKAELFLHSQTETTPAAILDRINQGFLRYTGRVKPMSFWLAIFDPATRLLRYSSAANPYPILLRPGEPPLFLGFAAYPVGARKGKFKEEKLLLNPGDRIVMYSDGIIESANSDEELIGYDRFVELAAETFKLPPEKAIEEIMGYARDWANRDIPMDDMTVVVFSMVKNEAQGVALA